MGNYFSSSSKSEFLNLYCMCIYIYIAFIIMSKKKKFFISSWVHDPYQLDSLKTYYPRGFLFLVKQTMNLCFHIRGPARGKLWDLPLFSSLWGKNGKWRYDRNLNVFLNSWKTELCELHFWDYKNSARQKQLSQ